MFVSRTLIPAQHSCALVEEEQFAISRSVRNGTTDYSTVLFAHYEICIQKNRLRMLKSDVYCFEKLTHFSMYLETFRGL